MTVLSQAQLKRALATLAGWDVVEGMLTKTYKFEGYGAAVDFTTAIARRIRASLNLPSASGK